MKDIIVDSPVLLDTHVLIWSLSDFENLSDQVKKIIDIAKNENKLLISSIRPRTCRDRTEGWRPARRRVRPS